MHKLLGFLVALLAFGCQSNNQPANSTSRSPASSDESQSSASPASDQLSARLKTISDRAGGAVSVAVVHVESGRAASVNGSNELTLYSVFKFPLAVAVLKDVEEKRLQADQQVHITPNDIVPGTPSNTQMWQKPVDRTIAQLIDVSIALSDNTSSDKLMGLAGGHEAVTRRLRSLGFNAITIQTTILDFIQSSKNPNTGSADELARMLVRLQKGELLQPAQQDLLIASMRGAQTGFKRIRGDLPPGTQVANKTGSGEMNQTTKTPNATNDVGLITLPDGTHLAVAVLLNGSTLSAAEQEKVIAEISRASYDSFVK